MDKKMTSGEIAKKTGISQKAVRLYDEKGLLKPSEYSEGNYRLYDKEALLVLEKIIALKQIGFSLEEIRDNLIAEKNMNIAESLKAQLDILEAKKYEIERTIECIKNVLVRSDGKPDWNHVAEIVRMIQEDQKADERHFAALKHTVDNVDWYVKIFRYLDIQADSKILDLGCGFAKLWRNNWTDIPQGVRVDAVDVHGSWADNFAEFVTEHKNELATGTDIKLLWGDIDEDEVWAHIDNNAPYNCIVAHYLLSFLKDKEKFISRVSSAMADGGIFSCNGYAVSCEHSFWKELFNEMKLSSVFISKVVENKRERQDEFKDMLHKYFTVVESVQLGNKMRYDNSEELFARLGDLYPEEKKYFADNESKIKAYLAKRLAEQGTIVVDTDSQFWNCYK